MRLPCFLGLIVAALFISCARLEKSSKTDTAASAHNRAGERAGAKADRRDPCLNINTATREELMRLPGIGEATSRKIIEYRERHGPFRRPEEVIIIEGFSEQKYRPLAGLICAE